MSQPKAVETHKPKFRRGQVVSVRSFYGNFEPGETGPGFKGARGWRHGFEFGKIVKIIPADGTFKTHCYFLDGWMSAMVENDLRPITKMESGNL